MSVMLADSAAVLSAGTGAGGGAPASSPRCAHVLLRDRHQGGHGLPQEYNWHDRIRTMYGHLALTLGITRLSV